MLCGACVLITWQAACIVESIVPVIADLGLELEGMLEMLM